MAHLLEVRNLKTEFHQDEGIVKAVNGVSYYVDPGEIISFVGESGSGKSVTQYSGIQLLPNAHIAGGEVLFEGTNILEHKPNGKEMRQLRGGEIGLIFQEPMTSLNPVMTIGKQIMESVLIHTDMDRKQAKQRVIELLKMVEIPDAETRFGDYPHQFSGGMRQRIVIAMALACNPKLLIADEATTALDVTIQAQILELMKNLVKNDSKMALIIITHNLSLVARYAERVYVMYAGEIVESANIRDLFFNPRHPYTNGLLHAVPSLNDPKERKLVPIDGRVLSLLNRKDACPFQNRCQFCGPECQGKPSPQLHDVPGDQGHFVACYRNLDRRDFEGASVSQVREVNPRQPGENEKPLLQVKDLKVYFPVRKGFFKRTVGYVKAVDGVSFDIYEGETFGLVGESGCGKSTVARSLLKLNKAFGGTVEFNGHELTRMSDAQMKPLRRDMTMVFQDPYGSLDPRQRAIDIVAEPMRNYNRTIGKKEVQTRVAELFDTVGLDPAYMERMPHEFSGGQRQRLAIARALALNPKFIVCDEAISALDVSVQAQIINLLEQLQAERNLTYLFIAHDLSVVRHISDRVAVMYLGQIVELGTWEEVYDHPMHPYTIALLSSVPIPDPVVEDGKQIKLITGEIPSPVARPKGCAFSTRCPYATDRCRTEMPAMQRYGKTHMVSCWHIQDSE